MRNTIPAFILALSTVAGPTLAQDIGLCRQGATAFQNGQFERALGLNDACIHSGDLPPKLRLIVYRDRTAILEKLKRYDEAIDWATRTLELQPPDAWADHVTRGNLQSLSNRYDLAMTDYDSAEALRPSETTIPFNRGIVYERQGLQDRALEQFLVAYQAGMRTQMLMQRLAVHRAFDPPAKDNPVAATSSRPALAPNDGSLQVNQIGQQTCSGLGIIRFQPHPEAASIAASRSVPLPAVGMRFNLPKLTDKSRPSLAVHSGDRARGVVDHYVLLSKVSYGPVTAAVVVTELSAAADTPEKVLQMGLTYHLQQAQRVGVEPRFYQLRAPDGSQAYESVTQQRTGSMCFPTSEFKMIPTAIGPRTVGISRFIVSQGKLVEFAMVIEVPSGTPPDEVTQAARQAMDAFWQGLKPL